MNATNSPANLPESAAAFLKKAHQAHDYRYRNHTVKPPYPTLQEARIKVAQRNRDEPELTRILAQASQTR